MKVTKIGFLFPSKNNAGNPEVRVAPEKSTAERVGKNDDLFKSLTHIEEQVDAIVSNGTKKYIDGIKQNILDTIMRWFESDDESFFFLFGNMGTGKSFFSAKLYGSVKYSEDSYAPVIYSSQQTYPATANVENMLLVIAARLSRSIHGYAEYFKDHELGEKNIEKLTEKVLIEPFEHISLGKKVFIIIDGLDEYTKNDCTKFLDALTRLAPRMSPLVRIFFSSRPEKYIKSHLPTHSRDSEYMIEKQTVDCHHDCLAFIRAKSEALGITIAPKTEDILIKKSKFCLKYLQCVFDDPQATALLTEDGTVDKLPNGLLSFYREQLIRYFSDERAYKEDYLPLLEVICAAYRPLSVDEIADILGRSTDDINDLILRAGTLIYKSDNIVYLYQSESIKPYLSDERNCPENFLVKPENGRRRILSRISELIEDEDLYSNDYLMFFAADHILDMAEKNENDAWDLLFKLIVTNLGQRDMIRDMCATVVTKSQKIWQKFLQKLFKAPDIDPVLKDDIASKFMAAVRAKNLTPTLFEVVAKLNGRVDYRYYELLVHIRHERMTDAYDDAIAHAKEALEIIDNFVTDARLQQMRYSYIYDEMQRVYKFQRNGFRKTVEYAAKLFVASELALEACKPHDTVYPILMRNHSVSYDQIGRLFEKLLKYNLSRAELSEVAEILCPVLHTPSAGAKSDSFLIRQAIYCHEKSLEIAKRLQMIDSDSKFSLYDVSYPLVALGRLYAMADFPGKDLDKSIKYLEDSLSICERISERALSEATDTHPLDMKCARAPFSTLDELIEIYENERNFDKCIEYIFKERAFAELLNSRYPSEENHFSVVATYEDEARIKGITDGIHAAKDMYEQAAELYTEGAKEWDSERFLRAPGIVFDRLSTELERIDDHAAAVIYRRKTVEIDKAVFDAYPSANNEYYTYWSMINLADTLKETKDTESVAEALTVYNDVLEKSKDFVKRHPIELYERAPIFAYLSLILYYIRIGEYDTAQKHLTDGLAFTKSFLERYGSAYNASFLAMMKEYEAKIIIALEGPEKAEERALSIADYCDKLHDRWENDDILRYEGCIFDYLADAFEDSENHPKVLEYRMLSADTDAKICALYPSENNLYYYCLDAEAYADELMKTEQADNIEKAITVYSDVIEKYKYLSEKYPDQKYERARLPIYDSLLIHYTDTKCYAEAEKVLAEDRALSESLLARYPSAVNAESLAIAYRFEAKILISVDGAEKSEERALMLAAECEKLHGLWKTDRLLRFEGLIFDYLAEGFDACDSHDKALEYRKLSVDIDERICELYPSEKNFYYFCMDAEIYADLLMKTEAEDKIEEAITVFKYIIDRYNILYETNPDPKYLKDRLSVYNTVISHFTKTKCFTEAEKYLTQKRIVSENLFNLTPNEQNEFNLYYTCEQEAFMVQNRDGVEIAEPMFVNAAQRFADLALKTEEGRAIRSVYRIYSHLLDLHEDDRTVEPFASYYTALLEFAEAIMKKELDADVRYLVKKWTFGESARVGEVFAKISDDNAYTLAVRSYETAIAIGLDMKESHPDFAKTVDDVFKKLELVLVQIKIGIKYLNASDEQKLRTHLELAVDILSFFKWYGSEERFGKKESELLEKYKAALDSLK